MSTETPTAPAHVLAALRVCAAAGIDTGDKYAAAIADIRGAAERYALWPLSTAAAHCGITLPTWRSYSRNAREGRGPDGFPEPVGRDLDNGELLYRAVDVRAWQDARPGLAWRAADPDRYRSGARPD